jgi:hypothetical protein
MLASAPNNGDGSSSGAWSDAVVDGVAFTPADAP